MAGHDPDTGDRWFQRCCPVRNVTRDYPPTPLAPGTRDSDVPYDESKSMADRLRPAGVYHQLVTVPEGAHAIGNIAPQERDRIHRQAAMFQKERA